MISDAAIILEMEMRKAMQAKAGTYQCCAQAYALGLTFLRKAHKMGIKTPEALDIFRRKIREALIEMKDEKDEIDVVVGGG